VIQASKQIASFFFNKISIATRNQNLVNRVIGGDAFQRRVYSHPLIFIFDQINIGAETDDTTDELNGN
jgi:hypothetical protein